ncbi:hypothetical protein HNQ71_001668 [Mesorhizobium sangaii]|uniref:Uncharacterized protein n=1 Tax=Mesorhizobium sangaii TaxID=505389 RepID=A0A841P138_9HYPH|nr:hypothetical protein [Mesorhizobium sangaii]
MRCITSRVIPNPDNFCACGTEIMQACVFGGIPVF